MAEPSRLKVILLLIAMAQLATEVTRLVVAWTPSHIAHNMTGEQMGSGQHDPYGSENRQEPPSARGPPPGSGRYGRQPAWQCDWRYDKRYNVWYYRWCVEP